MDKQIIMIRYSYTTPNLRSRGESASPLPGHPRSERLEWDGVDDAPEWARDTLDAHGCTWRESATRYLTQDAKVLDFAQGVERAACADLFGFTPEQLEEIAESFVGN